MSCSLWIGKQLTKVLRSTVTWRRWSGPHRVQEEGWRCWRSSSNTGCQHTKPIATFPPKTPSATCPPGSILVSQEERMIVELCNVECVFSPPDQFLLNEMYKGICVWKYRIVPKNLVYCKAKCCLCWQGMSVLKCVLQIWHLTFILISTFTFTFTLTFTLTFS